MTDLTDVKAVVTGATSMIPDELPEAARTRLLPPQIMGPPVVFLASAEAEKLTGERIVAVEFDVWSNRFRAGSSPQVNPATGPG